MRRLVLYGAFGGANIGDEVIFYADKELAKRIGISQPFGVLVSVQPKGATTAELYDAEEVSTVHHKSIFHALRLLWGADLFIGGGQVIDGAYGIKVPLLQYIYALTVRLSGGRVCIGGAGAFRLRGAATRFFYARLFDICHDIALRDAASLKEISYSGAGRRKGRVAADIVFSLRELMANRSSESRREVGFAVHSAPHASFMKKENAAQMVAELWRRHGENLSILVHDSRPNFDLDFARDIVECAQRDHGAGNIRVRSFETVGACLDYYARSALVVSARMHPLIIGAISGARCVPLAGSRKVAQFAEQLGLQKVQQDDLVAFVAALEAEQMADSSRLSRLEANASTLMDGFRR